MNATRSSRLAFGFATQYAGHPLRCTSIGYLLNAHALQISLAHCQQKAENKQWKNPQYYFACQFHFNRTVPATLPNATVPCTIRFPQDMPGPEPELEWPILILIELHVDINRRHGCQFACANPIRQRESIAESTELCTKYY